MEMINWQSKKKGNKLCNVKMVVIELRGVAGTVKNMLEMIIILIILMNWQSEEKEKKSDKLCNVEVKQLLSQCTLSHLQTNNDDAVVDDDGVDGDGVGHDLGGYLLLFPQSLQHSLRTFV